MKNKLKDLNNYLFLQLEKLSDEEIRGEELREEIIRAHAVKEIAKQIIANGNLVLEARKFEDTKMNMNIEPCSMLEG